MFKRFTLVLATIGLLLFCSTLSSQALDKKSNQVSFFTRSNAPEYFDNWTFFWVMPKIDSEALLKISIYNSDGKLFYDEDFSKRNMPSGAEVRSDWWVHGPQDVSPDMFFGKGIEVRFQTSKGEVIIPDENRYKFQFYKKGTDGNTQFELPFWQISSSTKKNNSKNVYTDEISFYTHSNAPDHFGAWAFYWNIPRVSDKADFEYVVIDPDGKEIFNYILRFPPDAPGHTAQSSFSDASIDRTVFWGKKIQIKMRVTAGKIDIINPDDYRFEFYDKQLTGAFDWDKPFLTFSAARQ
jgi:hypothetical protein